MVGFRRDWLTQMDSMQREMERLLDHFAGSKPPMMHFARRIWEPAVDIYDTTDAIVIIVELAGIKIDDLTIIVDRERLAIKGERKTIGIGTKRTYYQMEIASGPFERIISLPAAIDPAKTKATYSNGIVEIKLPKIEGERNRKVGLRVIHIRRSS